MCVCFNLIFLSRPGRKVGCLTFLCPLAESEGAHQRRANLISWPVPPFPVLLKRPILVYFPAFFLAVTTWKLAMSSCLLVIDEKKLNPNKYFRKAVDPAGHVSFYQVNYIPNGQIDVWFLFVWELTPVACEQTIYVQNKSCLQTYWLSSDLKKKTMCFLYRKKGSKCRPIWMLNMTPITALETDLLQFTQRDQPNLVLSLIPAPGWTVTNLVQSITQKSSVPTGLTGKSLTSNSGNKTWAYWNRSIPASTAPASGPPRFHAKRGWPRPSAWMASLQTYCIFNELFFFLACLQYEVFFGEGQKAFMKYVTIVFWRMHKECTVVEDLIKNPTCLPGGLPGPLAWIAPLCHLGSGLIKVQHISQGGHSGLRPWPTLIVSNLWGRPKPGGRSGLWHRIYGRTEQGVNPWRWLTTDRRTTTLLSEARGTAI